MRKILSLMLALSLSLCLGVSGQAKYVEKIPGVLQFMEQTTPATPPTGWVNMFASGDTIKWKDSSGKVHDLYNLQKDVNAQGHKFENVSVISADTVRYAKNTPPITLNQGAISLGLDDTFILHRMDFSAGESIKLWSWGVGETDGTSLSNTDCYIQIYNITDSSQAASTQSSFVKGAPIGTYDVSGDTVKVEIVNNKQDVTYAILSDVSVGTTDYTTEFSNPATNDVDLLPTSPATDDSFNIAMTTTTENTIRFDIGTAASYATIAITWEYSQGNGNWASLSNVVDGTNSFQNSGVHDVTFDIPGDWAQETVGGKTGYFIRGRLSSFVAGTNTVQPLADQGWEGKVRTLSSFITFTVED